MCGLAGFIDRDIHYPEAVLQRMTDAIKHRGPDDEGHWCDKDAGVALGHRRLSILDLSPAGHQPMHSASGRFVIAFNGEIYNHGLVRAELERLAHRQWRGHSDTEVILEAFETWGVEAATKRFIGMFGIALWDRKERVLHLIRDRLGEKPLYYGMVGTSFLFSSELKAMCCFPNWEGVINRDALALLLRHNYIPAPYTIYKGIHKLQPGTILSLPLHSKGNSTLAHYWSAREAAERGLADPFIGTDDQAIIQLDELLRDAIFRQMEADVPLGAFLSGGVDSSAIVALMQAQSSRPVKTFTIGFHEKGYNEAVHAKQVAQHLGTDHTELYINPSDALDVIPRLPSLYDEPFSDSSQIPTFLVSQLTKNFVTVSLSGDAGDELFGGYNRYFWGKDIWNKIGWMPTGMRSIFANGLRLLSPQAWNGAFSACCALLPDSFKQRTPGDKLHKLAGVLDVSHPIEMYKRLVSHWQDPAQIVLQSNEPPTALTDRSIWLSDENFTLQMMYMDLITYLPDDILVKVDRSAMGVSLETRVPFLDHRIVEFAWRLPLSMKIRNGQGKWVLRQVLYNYVPRELIERPKTGFGVPIDTWLRGPLRDWAESLICEERLKEEGFFHPAPIRKKWLEHLSGKRNWQYYLWDVLMFQAWLEGNKSA
jgi:asparagine synthase (glutamine-hydrolysing)